MKEFWKYFWGNIRNVIKDIRSNDKEKRRKQIPNMLTLIRGILAPATIIPAVLLGQKYVAFVLVALCSLTDSFDGWYARKYNAQSEFGALLDAICDKLFILTLAFPLSLVHTRWIITTLILELIISIINSYSRLKGFEAKSSMMGKIKTVVLDSSVGLCYLDFFIIKIPEAILGTTTLATNVMQVLCVLGYYLTYRNQKMKEKNK